MIIEKFNIYLANLNPQFGTEAGKIRPVIVVQNNLLNQGNHTSTLICPITTKIIPASKFLRIHLTPTPENGLVENSDIMIDQIRAIDNTRLIQHLGCLSEADQFILLERLKILILE